MSSSSLAVLLAALGGPEDHRGQLAALAAGICGELALEGQPQCGLPTASRVGHRQRNVFSKQLRI